MCLDILCERCKERRTSNSINSRWLCDSCLRFTGIVPLVWLTSECAHDPDIPLVRPLLVA